MRTLTTGIAGMMQKAQSLNLTLAGSVVALTPIFLAYLFAQRYLREGVTMTGVKG
jgi:multiple sugar transport system permease protein